ncbi:MAG: hypothetical protein JNK74_05905 [Candidatus Hydrogenedentes bacterium]|nr:hypothetical protein [Candidatus Hydrogenedentota bacterium]
MRPSLPIALAVLFLTTLVASAQAIHGIPLKPDPPIAVDGALGDWSAVVNAIMIDQPGQAVFGAGAWGGATDLSGTVHLAWREDHLYLAAEVKDDVLAQAQRGVGLWQGDHVELYLDVTPDVEPGRAEFGAGQFQIALSPGNFGVTGDPLADTQPEVFVYKPRALALEGALIASTQTAEGWILEAAIPWKALGIAPVAGLALGVEVGLSDTDGAEAHQDTLLTTGTAVWEHTRARLHPMILAGSDGLATPTVKGQPLFDALVIPQGGKERLTFEAPAAPEGQIAVIRLMARLDFKQVAGYTPSLRLVLNGVGLSGERLLNKKLRQASRGGDVYSMYSGEQLAAYYSPDFEAPNHDNHYGLQDGVIPCLFELDVTDLLKVGANDLVVQHSADERIKEVLHAGQAELVFRAPAAAERAKAGPPTGPIATIAPGTSHRTTYTAAVLPESRIALKFGDTEVMIESQFSTPAPGWVTGSNDYFRHSRRVEERGEGVVVFDTFTNLTSENLGIMHRHQAKLGADLKRLWIAGLEQSDQAGQASTPANCTTFGASEKWGLGLIASDDVFRVHSTNYGAEGSVGVADNNLVLPPGASYTAEWIAVPVPAPDYYTFINIARRFMEANFVIEGGFAFLRSGELTDVWSDEQVKNFLEWKDPEYVCASIFSNYKGRYAHGTAFQQVEHESFKKSFARWRGLYDATYMVYFHCFLDVTDEGVERYADARTLRPDGKQADYGKEDQRIYLPMTGNLYGAEVRKNVDVILDEIGADGVYWDEHEYSSVQYHYGEPWDRISGDIDPKSMQVRGLKSSVTLLTEDWRVGLAKYIQSRGPLIGNGAPYTRAMTALEFPCFVETGNITNCTLSHLYSPIALGDHLTEHSQQDAYATMLAALDYGCVYHWYNDMTVTPTHPTITSQMFPITPLELHQGYIIGKERIVTKLSGRYGWGDASQHEVHVYNERGEEVPDFMAPFTTEEGKTWTELRIGEDWSAVIVRE